MKNIFKTRNACFKFILQTADQRADNVRDATNAIRSSIKFEYNKNEN